jgi:SAM-dependent methyltransferase
MQTPGDNWRTVNRRWWDERAPAHAAGSVYDVEAFVAGRDDLRPFEDDELGPVDGLDLVHLQCHIGTDTICWARRGARVVGLDFSPPALEAAGDLARRCGVAAEWVLSDVYDAVTALDGRRFDVVYTGIGAINWLPDLGRWAATVHDLLRPGGRLYLVETHPMWNALGDDGRTLREDAITGAYRVWDDQDDPDAAASYGAPGATFDQQTAWERLHPLGDVMSSVLGAGLELELFHEWPYTPAPTTWLEHRDDDLWHFAADAIPFPVMFSLRARRPDRAGDGPAQKPGSPSA